MAINLPLFDQQNAIESFIKSLTPEKRDIGGIVIDELPPLTVYFSDTNRIENELFSTQIKLEGQAMNCLMKIIGCGYNDLNYKNIMSSLNLNKDQYLIIEPTHKR